MTKNICDVLIADVGEAGERPEAVLEKRHLAIQTYEMYCNAELVCEEIKLTRLEVKRRTPREENTDSA